MHFHKDEISFQELSCETGSITVGKRIKLPESARPMGIGIHTNDSYSISQPLFLIVFWLLIPAYSGSLYQSIVSTSNARLSDADVFNLCCFFWTHSAMIDPLKTMSRKVHRPATKPFSQKPSPLGFQSISLSPVYICGLWDRQVWAGTLDKYNSEWCFRPPAVPFACVCVLCM